MAERDGDGRRYYRSWVHMVFWQALGCVGQLLWEPVIQWRLARARRQEGRK